MSCSCVLWLSPKIRAAAWVLQPFRPNCRPPHHNIMRPVERPSLFSLGPDWIGSSWLRHVQYRTGSNWGNRVRASLSWKVKMYASANWKCWHFQYKSATPESRARSPGEILNRAVYIQPAVCALHRRQPSRTHTEQKRNSLGAAIIAQCVAHIQCAFSLCECCPSANTAIWRIRRAGAASAL